MLELGPVPLSWSGVALGSTVLLLLSARSWRRTRAIDRHRRGTRVLNAGRRRRLRDSTTRAAVSLGGVQILPLEESKHFKLIGTTGTGKSTAIGELLQAALRRGDRAVVADPEGAYRVRLHRRYRGDVLLNPFESGSLRWDPFAELREGYDVDQLASALIPDSEDASTREWRAYARTFFGAVLRGCRVRRRRSLLELWRLLAMASSDELRKLVFGTAAQPFLDADNARMFGSIRSVLLSAVAGLEYVARQRAAPFSVREWVRTGRGVLFIPYRAAQVPALRSLIAAWMRLAIIETMHQPQDSDQRLWFVVDELDALGAIDGLKDALVRLRKFGGVCVLGFQSIAQVSSTYGAGEAQTIVENCGNTLILRCSAGENGGTAQFASRLIGEREVMRAQTSRGRDRESGLGLRGARRSLQISEQCVTEPAVMPSELEQLPDLSGFLKLASTAEWRRVSLLR